MPRTSCCDPNRFGRIAAALVLLVVGTAYGTGRQQANASTQQELWKSVIGLADHGDFPAATEAIQRIHGGGATAERIRGWLEEYETKQAQRKELDREDFEKYTRYAKRRIERKEYRYALEWVTLAADCAGDREAFLASDWIQSLVNDALTVADTYRKKAEWQDAWHLYSWLSGLFDHERRYQKLEQEIETLLRLDMMFQEDHDWKERLERVRWEDAEDAIEYIEQWYVERPDFKRIGESGLEQLLLLAESKTAQKEFKGLGNEFDRMEFEDRIRERLDQIRAAPTLSRREVVRIFRRVVKDINRQTARLPEELIVSELMRGALEPLDDYTTIIWPLAADEFDKHTRGDFIGVGISIVKNRRTDEIEVVTPLEDTPAFRAGVQAGDIIAKVDGTSIRGFSLTKVVDIITGPKNTMVNLTIRRDGEEIEFLLKRAKVKIQSIVGVQRKDDGTWNYWLDPDLGISYIRIKNFQRNTKEDLINVLSALEAKGLNALVLDLRGNPGGLLDSAYRISELFLERGENVVSTRGRSPAENQTFDVSSDGAWSDLPITVIVDESSASASEIVAGALRDNNHGVVLGARTFGKFSVQNLISLSRSHAKLKLTTARYYLPSGVSLHRTPESTKWGVEPNIPIRLVRKEKVNFWKMRRAADLIGPPKPESSDDEKGDEPDGDDAKSGDADKADATGKGPQKDGEAVAVAKEDEDKESDSQDVAKGEKETLPPLDEPDENNRPMEDSQLDTALLLMRVQLLARAHPTLAQAEASQEEAGRVPIKTD